jgi:glucose-6-phosphate 1-dehydrogenase
MRHENATVVVAEDGAIVAPPCAMVIFGAAGDLTERLVVPALYNLVNAKRLPNAFRLVGVDLAANTVEEWRKTLTDTMEEFVGRDGEFQIDHVDRSTWQWLTERMSNLQGDLNGPREPAGAHRICPASL